MSVSGIERRFADADDLIVAAVTLPHIRLRWCSDDAMKDRAKSLLRREMSRFTSAALNVYVESGSEEQSEMETDDEFFGFSRDQTASTIGLQQECDMYLSDESKTLDMLKKFPTVKEVFLRYNTGIPSSAPVERLFSAAWWSNPDTKT